MKERYGFIPAHYYLTGGLAGSRVQNDVYLKPKTNTAHGFTEECKVRRRNPNVNWISKR